MAKKTVSLSVEEEIYEEYRKYCEQKGIILSKQFENFMAEELKKNKERNKFINITENKTVVCLKLKNAKLSY